MNDLEGTRILNERWHEVLSSLKEKNLVAAMWLTGAFPFMQNGRVVLSFSRPEVFFGINIEKVKPVIVREIRKKIGEVEEVEIIAKLEKAP